MSALKEAEDNFRNYLMNQARFIDGMNAMQKDFHATAVSKGWWDNPAEIGTLIALIHSELSEALEAARISMAHPDDKIPHRPAVEVELADAVIRIMDVAEHFGLDVAGAVIEKAEFNKSRPVKHGGKKF